jgi:hypothetical protein
MFEPKLIVGRFINLILVPPAIPPFANVVPHAVHLGTDVGKDVENTAVNGAWNAFALANPGDIIGDFNQIRHWAGTFRHAQEMMTMFHPQSLAFSRRLVSFI